ncbi:hypothetical protein CHUAL_006962 [Chamberlinius hualienensis]
MTFLLVLVIGLLPICSHCISDDTTLDLFHEISSLTGVNPISSNGYLILFNNFTQTVLYDHEDAINRQSSILTVSPSIILLDQQHLWTIQRVSDGNVAITPVGGSASGVICTGQEPSTPASLCQWPDSPSCKYQIVSSGNFGFFVKDGISMCLATLGVNSPLSVNNCEFSDPRQQWLLCNPTNTTLCWPTNLTKTLK